MSSVYKMTARKAAVRIPHIRIGGKLRFRQSDIDRWLTLLTVRTSRRCRDAAESLKGDSWQRYTNANSAAVRSSGSSRTARARTANGSSPAGRVRRRRKRSTSSPAAGTARRGPAGRLGVIAVVGQYSAIPQNQPPSRHRRSVHAGAQDISSSASWSRVHPTSNALRQLRPLHIEEVQATTIGGRDLRSQDDEEVQREQQLRLQVGTRKGADRQGTSEVRLAGSARDRETSLAAHSQLRVARPLHVFHWAIKRNLLFLNPPSTSSASGCPSGRCPSL